MRHLQKTLWAKRPLAAAVIATGMLSLPVFSQPEGEEIIEEAREPAALAAAAQLSIMTVVFKSGAELRIHFTEELGTLARLPREWQAAPISDEIKFYSYENHQGKGTFAVHFVDVAAVNHFDWSKRTTQK